MALFGKVVAVLQIVLVALGAVAAFAMTCHIVADVLWKYLFNAPFSNTITVVSGYYMVAVSLLPLAYVAKDGGHIVVELFTQRLAPRNLNRLETVVGLASLAYLLLLSWKTAEEAWVRTVEGEVWETAIGFIEIWPSRWLVPVGCAALALAVLHHTIACFQLSRSSADPAFP